jgi:hypothetical protein
VADTSGEGDEQDEREQRCCAVGNRVQRSDSIHGSLAGPSATGCLSICLSTVPQDAVQHRTILDAPIAHNRPNPVVRPQGRGQAALKSLTG